MEANAVAMTRDNVAALDAALTDNDWTLVQNLWRAGVGDGGMYRLLRLRTVYRRTPPQMDGLAADPYAQFARWLVASGRLHDGS